MKILKHRYHTQKLFLIKIKNLIFKFQIHMPKSIKFIFIYLITITPLFCFSQTKGELNKQKSGIEKEIIKSYPNVILIHLTTSSE